MDSNLYPDRGATKRPSSQSETDRSIQRADEFRREGRWGQAIYFYRAAIENGGDCFAAQLGLGEALFGLGKWREAVTPLRCAIAVDANSAEAHAALGLALDRLSEWHEAVAAFEASLTLRPADPPTLQNLGGALSRLDRRAELDEWLEKALAAEPQTAALHGMLAAQHLAFGRLDEAVQAMDRMIALDPADGLAHAFLSEMKTYTPGDPHLVALQRAVSQGAARPANERCVVRYGLAKAYSDVGRDEDAFRLRLEANHLRRQTIEYDLAHTLSEFQSLQSVFTPQLMQAKRGLGDPSDRPVFIVGVMRSGTTLVEQILTSHARVFGFGEMPNFRDAAARTMQRYPEEVAGLSADDLRRMGAHYLRLSAAAAGSAARITDKTLINDVFVGLIHLALPHARIIHVVRDPVDTCLSAFAMNFGTSYPYTCDLSELGRYYRAQRRMMEHWRSLLPESAFLEVRYENLVADIESEVRRMLRFCDLDWDPAVLAFDKSARAVWTASAAQIRRPLYTSSVGRWRPPPDLLRPLLEGLGEYAPPEAGP